VSKSIEVQRKGGFLRKIQKCVRKFDEMER
jgi:hypothetical protein